VRDVVNASSGASWIFADRIERALTADFAPRAAAKLLAKDVAIAAALAERLRVDAPFSKLASRAFAAAVAAGHARMTTRSSCASRSTLRIGPTIASAASRPHGRDASHFGRALMSTSTYCQTCPLMG
jgi:hypothetical protein